jgi:glycosyltransferase involved in cell wall biosynthesis
MRVALIIYGSLNTVTGGYIYDCKLVDYLRSKGVVVQIFSQPNKNFFGSIRNNFSKKIVHEIAEFSPDLILQDEMNFLSLFLLNRKLKHIGNCSIVSIVHLLQSTLAKNNLLYRWLIKQIEKIYLRSVNNFIFNSLATETAVMHMIKKNTNSLVARPGKDRLNLDMIKDNIVRKCYEDKLKIIFIGNVVYNKGLHVLLQALLQIDSNLWQLSVVGNVHFEPKYTTKILKMISSLKLENNIKLLGTLDIPPLKAQLISHHILAVPSYYESFGIVYAEAMGAGLPVIASKLGGAPEIINDTINGFLVTPGDIVTVRDVINKLITNRQLLAKMSYACLAAYREMPSWDESMEKIFKTFQQMEQL